jgi:plastocyanin
MRSSVLALMIAAPAMPPARPPQPVDRVYRLVEHQNQIANLLTAGKLAYDAGDFATAAEKWDALLRLDHLPPEIDTQIRPLLQSARKQAGQPALETPAAQQKPEEQQKPATVTVNGTIGGGGQAGPGGAVITLKPLAGFAPRATPVNRVMFQKNKSFSPHVMAVPVGSTINFKNADEIFHNVFALGSAAAFDTGLKKGGDDAPEKFDHPGVIELLCNIHATMLGFVVVVDTPYYAVSDGTGAFAIKNVPPGEYEASVWHESASNVEKRKVKVDEGTTLAFTVATDKRPNPFPPDKYGKPRQQQLGY